MPVLRRYTFITQLQWTWIILPSLLLFILVGQTLMMAEMVWPHNAGIYKTQHTRGMPVYAAACKFMYLCFCSWSSFRWHSDGIRIFKENLADAGKMELFQGILSHLQLCTTSNWTSVNFTSTDFRTSLSLPHQTTPTNTNCVHAQGIDTAHAHS